MDENLIPIKAISKGKKQAWTRWKKGRDKKRYAISSTALISTLAINRLIKWREKRARDPSTHPPIIPFVSPTFFLRWSSTRYQDRCVRDKAVQLVSFGKCSSFFPPSWTFWTSTTESDLLESVTLSLLVHGIIDLEGETIFKVSINLSVIFAKLISDLLIFSRSILVYLRRSYICREEEEIIQKIEKIFTFLLTDFLENY